MIKLNLNLEPKKINMIPQAPQTTLLFFDFGISFTADFKMLLVIKHKTKIQATWVSEVYTDAFLCQTQSLHALV